MQTTELSIRLEKRGHRGRYVLEMPEGEPAELTYVESGPDHIIIDHTWVPPPIAAAAWPSGWSCAPSTTPALQARRSRRSAGS